MGLFIVYMGLFGYTNIYSHVARMRVDCVCRTRVSVYGALLSVYGALLSVYGALLSVYGALLSVYGALLSVYGAFWRVHLRHPLSSV